MRCPPPKILHELHLLLINSKYKHTGDVCSLERLDNSQEGLWRAARHTAASGQRLTLEMKGVWSSMRLLPLLRGSHCNKQTHTYSLKTCVYTQPSTAIALSFPVPGVGTSGRCQGRQAQAWPAGAHWHRHSCPLASSAHPLWASGTSIREQRGNNYFLRLGAYSEVNKPLLSAWSGRSKIMLAFTYRFNALENSLPM